MAEAVDTTAIEETAGDLPAQRLRAAVVEAEIENQPLGIAHLAKHAIEGIRQARTDQLANIDVTDPVACASPAQIAADGRR